MQANSFGVLLPLSARKWVLLAMKSRPLTLRLIAVLCKDSRANCLVLRHLGVYLLDSFHLGVTDHSDRSCHCRMPYVTGSSVLALTYKDGVMLASDTLGAYTQHSSFACKAPVGYLKDETH